MSKFECPIVRVRIESHPNADAIEMAYVGDYISIVKKGQFQSGDLAVYVPEYSVLPEWLLKKQGFWDDLNNKGMLTSSAGNRVKAIKLRGILSQGILVGGVQLAGGGILLDRHSNSAAVSAELGKFQEGDNAAEFLNVVKWEQAVPVHLAGKVAGGDLEATIGYDFENIKKQPDLFAVGEPVVITEKLHGTLLQVGIVPKRIWEGKPWADKCPTIGMSEFKCIVTSKGQGAKGLMLDPTDITNLYVSTALSNDLWPKLEYIRTEVLGHPDDMPLFIFGEIYGAESTQDLKYGVQREFRAFDMYAGVRGNGFYLNDELFGRSINVTGIEPVPVLYRGPFDKDLVLTLTDGMTTLGGSHIREGVVVKSPKTALHPKWGRRIAKSISAAYLLRKGEQSELQ